MPAARRAAAAVTRAAAAAAGAPGRLPTSLSVPHAASAALAAGPPFLRRQSRCVALKAGGSRPSRKRLDSAAATSGQPPAGTTGEAREELSSEAGGKSKIKPWEERDGLFEQQIDPNSIDVDELIHQDLARLKPMKPRPVTISEMLEMAEPAVIGKFVHHEVPVRLAERIAWIEEIPDWHEIDEFREVHALHFEAFRRLRLVSREPDLADFTRAATEILESEADIAHSIARGCYRLCQERGKEQWGPHITDPWLDKFLLNRIGTDMLLTQYLACVEASETLDDGERKWFKGGIIDPHTDVLQIVRDVSEDVVDTCEALTGVAPIIKVELHAPWENERGAIVGFCFVPGFFKFIMTEVLKNSCKATADLVTSERELKKRPINVIVCADDHFVAIRVSDRAQGIPFEVGNRVWSYLYSTSRNGERNLDEDHANNLAGYGVGLPLSRLYARYLGGSLDIVSLPGYGTSVDLFLTRVSTEQLEIVPDDDVPGWNMGSKAQQPPLS